MVVLKKITEVGCDGCMRVLDTRGTVRFWHFRH
jgi:hypothetical protein